MHPHPGSWGLGALDWMTVTVPPRMAWKYELGKARQGGESGTATPSTDPGSEAGALTAALADPACAGLRTELRAILVEAAGAEGPHALAAITRPPAASGAMRVLVSFKGPTFLAGDC